MKTPNPLAAALLLFAASASAQLLSGPAGNNGFSMTGTPPFSFGSNSGPVDDIVFKCGTVPYIACTDAHLNKREAIRASGTCPAPASAACTQYLMSTRGAANPAETIAAYDPPPGRQWASPDCQRIPCRLAEEPVVGDEIVVTGRRNPAPTESGRPYDQQPGFIGPPAPPSGPSMPPAFSAADFQSELAAARADSENTIVDLGDNRYGVVLEDNTVAVCGRGQCNMPRPASEFPNLADQIQAATSRNSGAGSINNDNPNGFAPLSNPPPGDNGRSGRSSQGATPPEDVASTSSDEARSSGGDAGSFFRSNGGGMGASGGGTTGGGYTATAANGKEEAIATEAAELDGVFTYIKTQQIKAAIDKTAGAVTTGGDGTFVTPNTAPNANAGDLQFKGTQSGANR